MGDWRRRFGGLGAQCTKKWKRDLQALQPNISRGEHHTLRGGEFRAPNRGSGVAGAAANLSEAESRHHQAADGGIKWRSIFQPQALADERLRRLGEKLERISPSSCRYR